MGPQYAPYGSAPSSKLPKGVAASRRPALPALVACLFVPWLIFIVTFWLRSFELRRDAEALVSVLSCCLLLPVLVFAWMTLNLAQSGDPKLMAFLTTTSLLAWMFAFFVGGWNYDSFMRPYYDINNLNVYPSVDPSKYVGSQLMDAGMIQFTPGSALNLQKSLGFRNGDVYCVAPIVSSAKSNQSIVDFWAVGLNCCSGHLPDFRCGEYTNPLARWGLRLMDDSKRNMFRLAVKEAEATFKLKAPHPVFLYWLSDPTAEVNAYQDDGFKYFTMFVFTSFSIQFFLVVCVMGVLVKI